MTAPVRVTYVGHATVLVEIDGVRLLTDPVLRSRVGPLRRHGTPPDPRLAKDVDAVLISHLHHDHADAPSLRRLSASRREDRRHPAGAAAWPHRPGSAAGR